MTWPDKLRDLFRTPEPDQPITVMALKMEALVRIDLSRPTLPVSVSDGIEALLGFTADQFLTAQVALRDLVHPDDQDMADQLFDPLPGPRTGDFNLRLRQANGHIRCVKADYVCELTPAGGCVLALRLIDAKTLYQQTVHAPLTTDFVAMMENTDDFIFFKDRNHVFTGASQTLVSITQPARHWTDLLGQTDYDVFPEAYADAYYRLEKRVFAGFPVAHEVQEMRRNDGQQGWVDNRKYPIRDAQGRITGLFGVARDITEQKRTELALLASERRFHTIFEQVPSIAVQGYDRHRNVIFWNQASEKMYGYTQEQALGRKLEDLIIPQAMRDTVVRLVSAWVDGGPAIPEGNLTLQHANGSPVEVFSSHILQLGPSGDVEMYCLDVDVAQRKEAERALRASESFLRTIVDELPDPLVIKDHRGDFLLCNRSVAALYNTTPDAMVGKHDGDFGVPQEMADFFRQNVLDIMAKGQTQTVFEDSRDATTGAVRHYRSIKKPLKDPDGNNQILVVAQDITDVIRAQHQVAESEQRLQQVMEITREGIWDWHLPSGTVLHNPQWYKTLKYLPGEIPEDLDAFTALIHPDDQSIVWQRMDELFRGVNDIYHSEHRLLCKDGKTIWVQDRGRVTERDAQGKPTRVIGSFSDISYQREYQQHLEHIAHFDALTGLPNRVLLADRMHQAMVRMHRTGQMLVTAYLDLDGFKAVNDHHGHDVGDQLLTELAAQFKATLREGDTIARIGGDEFVAVFIDLPDVHSSVPLVRRLLDVASRTVKVGELAVHISASIGVAAYPQVDEVDADQLLRQADQAMYQAKLAGKGRYHVFDAEQDRSLRVRHESLQRIRQALDDHEFVLHYQPMVNLRTGEVVGAEALVRWQHPERGLLAPLTFLPEIEGHSLGLALGDWVLETALSQIEAWHDQGLDLTVSVNMSAHQLQQTQFADKLKAKLATHPKVQRGRLELEVLETSALADIHLVSDVIRACADIGVSFALDDFGTGYSSLTYLKRLPVHVLKIDQSFVRDMLDDPEDLAILEGVLGLALAFRRQAIAEGVETQAHCELLLRLGCDWAQGYGIARPMPPDKLPAWKSSWRPDPGWLDMPAVSREDLPVMYAIVEQRAWMTAVQACLDGSSDIEPTPGVGHGRLGVLLEDARGIRAAKNSTLQAIKSLHTQAQALAMALLALKTQGCQVQVDDGLVELKALRTELAQQLLGLL